MAQRTTHRRKTSESGVALILVMLAILVLTTLAAAMVFSARSETLASYNYRIGSQAEFVAQAGIQRALNFYSSSGYATLPPGQVPTGLYYRASKYAWNPVDMYFTDDSVVQCQTGCAGGSGRVTLGTSTSNSRYPPDTVTGVDVVSNWVAAMNNQTISDGRGGTGTFSVTASLLEYHTVNNAFFGVPAAGCGDAMANLGICRQTYEVWRVVSRGRWNSNIGGGGATPAVEMVATIGPLFVPYFGSALYGLCSATLSGTVCTDSYNSAVGQYGGASSGSCASAATSGTNAAFANAGVGSNGGVTINGNAVNVGGNVTYANQSSDPSCNTGFQGSDSGIGGAVLPGPAIPTPPLPDMTAWGYTPTNGSALDIAVPSGGGGSIDFRVVDVHLGVMIPPVLPVGISPCPVGFTAYAVSYTVDEASGAPPRAYTYNGSCTGIEGLGTSGDPYRLGEIEASQTSGTSATVNLIAPANGLTNPTYAAANEIVVGTGGFINLTGTAPAMPPNTGVGTYNPRPPANTNSSLVMNVATRVNLGGTSELNYNSAAPGTPAPDYLKINIHGTSSTALDLTGQSRLNALVVAPNGGARLQGSGAGGAFFGAILAKSVTDAGNYAVHYDMSAKVQSGSLFSPRIISVTRPKF